MGTNESIYCGQQLRKLRNRQELTQQDLAVSSGISSHRISLYEREGFPNKVKKKDIEALCDSLSCEPADLEKPILKNICVLGLGVIQDLLLSPVTNGKQHVAVLKYLESLRDEQPVSDDSESKDLTQIFNISVETHDP